MAETIRFILPDYEPSMALIPPFRFANIEPGLARGAYPTLMNFRFLSLLNLKTIVCLVPESPTQDLLDFCSFYGIQCQHFSVAKYNEAVTLTKEDMVAILQILIDSTNMPCYVHCLDGVNITGLVSACFRKLQNWDRTAIVHEFCKFGVEMISEELQFVDEFDGEIVVPDEVPGFLWNGLNFVKHPNIKLCQASALTGSGIDDDGQASYEMDNMTPSQHQSDDDPIRFPRRLSHIDIWYFSEDARIHENCRQHKEAKEKFSLTVRSMGLESSVAMQFRTRMLSLADLDSAQGIATSL